MTVATQTLPGTATMEDALDVYVANAAITTVDLAAARILVAIAQKSGATVEPSLLGWLGMCLAMRTLRDRHTCVHLAQIADWAGRIDFDEADPPFWPRDPQPWIEALETIPAVVGVPGDMKPFILEGADSPGGRAARLYLGQSYSQETAIAAALLRDGSRHMSILLGGPGTGKTYTLAKELIARFQDATTPPRIALAAPTGKAAARMKQALEKGFVIAQSSPEVQQALRAVPATTIHRLLGYNPARTPHFKHGPGSPLDLDLVVIDEVSMVSSAMLHALLEALGPKTEIRLVGDPNQLASVEAGSVLGDIAMACDEPGLPLHDRCQRLTKQHRYAADSAIARLATAIRSGDADASLALLSGGSADVVWIKPGDSKRIDEILELARRHARRLRELAKQMSGTALERAKHVLVAQTELQVLCARRTGPTGVAGWNQRIEKGLGVGPAPGWYSGRPIMITQNNSDLGLFNGDVGVVVPAEEPSGAAATGVRKDAVFAFGDEVIWQPVTRLEDVETVHALTIHKSQGSEYGHAIVVLPEGKSRLLTRELLYTGVTRAVEQVTVIGSEDVIRQAITTPIRRATGLAARLKGG